MTWPEGECIADALSRIRLAGGGTIELSGDPAIEVAHGVALDFAGVTIVYVGNGTCLRVARAA